MSNVLLLVGMISSGKSTYCKTLAEAGWIVINDDAIVNCVHNGDYTLYSKSLKPLYKSIENHIFQMAVVMGKDVVIDRGLSISLHARARWLALAKSFDVPIQAVVFEVFAPEVHAIRRFESDRRGHTYEYWLDVAQVHWGQYIQPTIDEGFDAVEFKDWVS